MAFKRITTQGAIDFAVFENGLAGLNYGDYRSVRLGVAYSQLRLVGFA